MQLLRIEYPAQILAVNVRMARYACLFLVFAVFCPLISTAEPMAHKVRIVTVNAYNGIPATNTIEYLATKTILERIDADIVAFQELTPSTSNNWSFLASDLGYPYKVFGRSSPFPGHNLGYFSRYPIISEFNVISPVGARELTRLPLRIVVAFPGAAKPLAIWNMHHKAYIDDLNSFRRAVEAIRIREDIDIYRARVPLSDYMVLLGDMNDYVERDDQAAYFTNLPSGLPGSYNLGDDIAFPIQYATFPVDRYSSAGGGLNMLDAYQIGTTNKGTMQWHNSRIDFMFMSTALVDSVYGAITSEVYNTHLDSNSIGMPKAGEPPPATYSQHMSDHYPVIADIYLSPSIENNLLLSPNDDSLFEGGALTPFMPDSVAFTLSNASPSHISWKAGTTDDWFDVSPSEGSLSGYGVQQLTVTVTSAATYLPPGDHYGAIIVGSEDTDCATHSIVRIRVLQSPSLAVSSPGPSSFTGIRYDSLTQSETIYTLHNNGDYPLEWIVTNTVSWLSMDPSSGIIAPRASTLVHVALATNVIDYPSGIYRATNTFINMSTGIGNSTRVLTLTMYEAHTVFVCAESGDDSYSGTSWLTPKQTLQAGVDAAFSSVFVTNGVYSVGGRNQSRVYIDRPLEVRSVNGPTVTTIVGQGPMGTEAVRCVWLAEGSSLSGFTLTNGHTSSFGMGGGVYAANSSVISNCVITECMAYRGGGSRSGQIFNTLVTGNTSTLSGGGTYLSDLYDSRVESCTSDDFGGGVHGGTIVNTLIYSNYAVRYGAGVSDATLINTTVVANHAGLSGGGVRRSYIYNSIVYYNSAPAFVNYQTIYDIHHSCTTPMPAGNGNTTNTPNFLNDDLSTPSLSHDSPCRDTGNNTYVTTTTDNLGNQRIIHHVVDMGAYEYQGESVADYDGDGMPNWWETIHGLSPFVSNAPNSNADSDWMTDIEEYIADTDPNNPNSLFPDVIISGGSQGELQVIIENTSTARIYGVVGSTNLAIDPVQWIFVTPEMIGTGSSVYWSVPHDCPVMFYRTKVRTP
jgi:endonuclease/exonuclease/phosphatase family metal-dependent hydrolase